MPIPAPILAHCTANGLDLTPARAAVLGRLWDGSAPVKAYALLDVLRGQGVGAAMPPTVYRALDYLMANGLAHKVHGLNAFMPCTHPGQHTTCLVLVCQTCGTAREACPSTWDKILPEHANKDGFKMESAIIEVFGRCGTCV